MNSPENSEAIPNLFQGENCYKIVRKISSPPADWCLRDKSKQVQFRRI